MNPAAALRATGFALLLGVAWMLLPLGLLRLPLWNWPIPDWPRLTAHLLGFVTAFGLGGVAALRLARRLPHEAAPERALRPGEGATRAILIITILMNIGALLVRASFNPFACGNLLECSNAAYQGYVEGSLAGEGALFEYVRILLSPLIYAGVALSIWMVVFREGREFRGYALVIIASEVVLAVATGTSRSMANLLLFGLLLKLLSGFDQDARRLSFGRKLWLLIGASMVMGIFFLYFSFLQLNRDGLVAAVGLVPFAGGYVEAMSFQTGSDNFVLKGVESVVRYLCAGYFSFSLALGLSGGQTFPLGASMFLAMRAYRGGDPSFVTHSLPGQIESHYGWSYMQQWHSIFSWLMSDYSALGVAIIMFCLGQLFTLSVFLALSRKSGPLAKMPMFIFFIAVLYVPANNQVFQSPEAAFSFLVAVLVLLMKLGQTHRLPVRVSHAAG